MSEATSKPKAGREELTAKVQEALGLATKKEAENVVNKVVGAIEQTLIDNVGSDKFTLKLNSFGKFTVRHKAGILRKIPFTGQTKMTSDKRKIKFVTLGKLRELEVVK
jgi:nucleoid DNA-binding protein